MSDKQQMSAVKFRVREKALMLGEFTVQEMVQATGLKRESVSTEVQRMKKEGLLVAESLPELGDGLRRRVGARPLLYRLTPDSQRRLQMARQLTSFYLPSTSARPTSRHYLAATRMLDRLMVHRDSDEATGDLIRQCGEALEYAWYDENEPQESVVAAFIERERARLCYVKGEHGEAQQLFRSAKEQFLSASLTEEAAQINDYLCAVELAQRWAQDDATAELQDRIEDVLAALRHAASNAWADNALLAMLVSLTTRLVAEPTVAVAAGAAAAAHSGSESLHFDIRRGVLKMATGHLAEPLTFAEPRYHTLTRKKPTRETHAHIKLHRREKKEQEDRIFSRSFGQQVFTME
jgi:hypothetical protein